VFVDISRAENENAVRPNAMLAQVYVASISKVETRRVPLTQIEESD
jgi:hypothetical protein